jgi:hypothetical protein
MPLTLWTVSWCPDSIITIMTLERAISEVIGECDTTVRTLIGEATIRAEDKIGKPPSIKEEQALFLIFDILLKCRSYLFREKALFILHINHLHPRKGLPFDPLREPQEMELSSLGIMERF